MKKIAQYLFILTVIVASAILTSCEIREEITFNKNGSGEILYTYNMSAIMQMMPSSEETKNTEIMDTVIDFHQLMQTKNFRDSINNLNTEQKEAFEAMKDMKMTMKMNSDTKEMIMGFAWGFKNINELTDVFSKIKNAQKLNNKTDDMGMGDSPLMKNFSGENQDLKFSYNGNMFSRTVTLKEKLSKEDKEQIDNMLKMQEGSEEMLELMKYTIVLNFPKPIKSINNENAVFSNNRKTVEISFPLSTYLYEPNLTSLNVKLK